MPVTVAEYLGQRTDIDNPNIQPAQYGQLCPFMNIKCPKIKLIDGKPHGHPVCSVRRNDGTLWITCEHRLCATNQKLVLTPYQKQVLLNIAKIVYAPSIKPSNVFVKREVRLKATKNKAKDLKADYIMCLKKGSANFAAPDRFILEMQGGGETSDTGKLSSHINKWRNDPKRTNIILRSVVKKTGILETNAWRRQQEQFIIKGNIAMQTWKGFGLVFCVGSILYDYLEEKIDFSQLPKLRDHNWTLALLGIVEDKSKSPKQGPIPLLFDEDKMLFTNYQSFVHALINQGLPSPEAFSGEYISLNGTKADLPIKGK